MDQRAAYLFDIDHDTAVFRARSSRRPLLAAIPVIVGLAAVIVAGIAGGHAPTERPWTHQAAGPTATLVLQSRVAEPTPRK
jgi:hypothetical protein